MEVLLRKGKTLGSEEGKDLGSWTLIEQIAEQ
jgi:hypothetical protein